MDARLYRFIKTKSVTRGYCEVRGAVQQGQDGSFDHATCGGKDQDPNGDFILSDRLAIEQKVWARSGCFQTINNVPDLPLRLIRK